MTNPHPEQPRSSDDLAGSLDHDHNKPRDSDDTLIASPAEDIAAEGAAASVFQNTPVKKQNNCNGLVSVGPRPLMLGTFKIATLSPCTPPKSRPASSLPPAPRTPTSPSARWSSYTPPLTPLSPTPSSPFSDEVETLKAQLAASEAMVKILMKEKFEAVSASRRLTVDLKNLQEQQSQWSEEKERMMAKLQELDEPEEVVTVAPLSPPPEGMWFGGSNKTRKPPKEIQSPLAKESPYPSSPDVHTPLPAVHWKVPELKISPPRSSDTHSDSELHDNQDTNPEISPRTSAGEETLARIGSIFLDRGPLDDGCDPTSTPSPASTPTASYFPPINHPSPGSSPVSPYRPRRWSHHRATAVDGSQFIPPTIRSATPPSYICLSSPSPRASLKADGPSPNSHHSFTQPRPNSPLPRNQLPYPDLLASASRIVGHDPCYGYPGRQVLHANAGSLLTAGNRVEGSPSSMNLATALDLHASMIRIAASSGRPRTASASPMWLVSNEPQINLSLNPLGRPTSALGLKTRRSFLSLGRGSMRPSTTEGVLETVNEQPAVESMSRRASPVRMKSFRPRSSSPLVAAPADSGEVGPKKKNRLSRLFEQSRSFVARIA